MALSYRVLYQGISDITSIDSVIGYISKHERNYDHVLMLDSILGRFKGELRHEIESLANFQRIWADLDHLIRTHVESGLKPPDHEILNSYCSTSDLHAWKSAEKKAIGVRDLITDFRFDTEADNQVARYPKPDPGGTVEYISVWESKRGIKEIASQIWEDIRIGLFSCVWDIVTGKVEICECVVDNKYCMNLFVREYAKQIYCDPLCRKRDGMRKLRKRQRSSKAELLDSGERLW